METTFVAHDNNEVLTVKLEHETSLVAYSTDKRSISPPKIMPLNYCPNVARSF